MSKLYISHSPEMGREMRTHAIIFPGDIVETCEILVLDQNDTTLVNSTALKHYTFKYDATRDCLVLGNGEIFNHADSPNVKYELKMIDGRHKMVFTATRVIFANEQLFIDYTADAEINVREYTNTPSMVG